MVSDPLLDAARRGESVYDLGDVPKGRVVHLKRDPFDVRIDRQTPWGNPFVLHGESDRANVIEQFRVWANDSTDPRAAWIREHVHELQGKTLGCWCAPKACHGDVLVAMAQSAPTDLPQNDDPPERGLGADHHG